MLKDAASSIFVLEFSVSAWGLARWRSLVAFRVGASPFFGYQKTIFYFLVSVVVCHSM